MLAAAAVTPVVWAVVWAVVAPVVRSTIAPGVLRRPLALVVGTCILAWALIGAGALVLAWVPARALTRVAAEVRTAWSAADYLIRLRAHVSAT